MQVQLKRRPPAVEEHENPTLGKRGKEKFGYLFVLHGNGFSITLERTPWVFWRKRKKRRDLFIMLRILKGADQKRRGNKRSWSERRTCEKEKFAKHEKKEKRRTQVGPGENAWGKKKILARK